MVDTDEKPKSKAVAFIANGGGAVTFRLLTTAMGFILLAVTTWGIGAISGRFDRLDAANDRLAQAIQNTTARVDVHANRLDHLDASDTLLWGAVHSNSVRLDDHEHRISIIEGARTPR